MAITIVPVQASAPSAPAAPVAPELTLQPGTVISAQVVQLLEGGLAQIAIDGIAIAALSEIPLQVGATLQLAVAQTSDGVIKLSVVPQAAANGTAVAPAADGAVTLQSPAAATSTAPEIAGLPVSGLRPATANLPLP